MILPVVKLGALVVKTACKPLAGALKKEAQRHPKFRSLIVAIAQANHRISTTMQRRLYGHSTDVAIRPLNEEKAVQAAADLFGELFVFLVAGSIVVFEVQRNARSEARKEELCKQELEGYYTSQVMVEHELQGMEECKNAALMESQHLVVDCFDGNAQLGFERFHIHQELPHGPYTPFDVCGQHGTSAHNISDLLPAISPPASAFLKPKCSLWDCPRPAKGSDWFEDYCSSIHAILALNEGPPGMTPVLRPGGIDLKDGPLFASLTAKTQGKNVGIPECEGAATSKSPWNAPELFDLAVLEGEGMREWLFFDKPRRAFESGNRKQRSLPDYNGRGWHESRKQILKEYGGLKRSYYMDPQPLNNFEWHLYEYEINNCDVCALYRLELKLVDAKKSAKGKIYGVAGASLVDMQQQQQHLQMGKLDSESPIDPKRASKSRAKVTMKEAIASDMYSGYTKDEDVVIGPSSNPVSPAGNEGLVFGPNLPYGYSVDNLHLYYGT